jgi:hypothetical protein
MKMKNDSSDPWGARCGVSGDKSSRPRRVLHSIRFVSRPWATALGTVIESCFPAHLGESFRTCLPGPTAWRRVLFEDQYFAFLYSQDSKQAFIFMCSFL